MQEIYAAHIREDGEIQTNKEHLEGTAALARSFAEGFGSGELGYLCGILHDIGKYSKQFQKRIRGSNQRVDHSAAGAIESNKLLKGIGWLLSYCIAGHHTGIPNGGSPIDTGNESTLHGRLKRSNIPIYSAFQEDIDIKAVLPKRPPPVRTLGSHGFSTAFFVRMLFSCLVDADFLNTETFMTYGKVKRNVEYNMGTLYERLLHYISQFESPANDVDKKRNEILSCCLKKASNPKGLYTLTVPTGGGKTISSFAFALNHAVEHKMDRVIYVIPYTSIIEQNALVFKEIVGSENVLEHHSNFNYDDENEDMLRYRYATENWDMPIIVTTNVQFFESLFANKTSKCRKLHNIANSVIIFDEAQMLPTEYLLPCVRAISELVYNYGSTAILCSATQPALADLFPKELKTYEICDNVSSLYGFFKRTQIIFIGELEDSELSKRLNASKQSLCILNTRRQAQNLYELLDPDGRYHLSTLMCPVHRSETLSEIRDRLKARLPCRVVSTSLIEAGVDLDFPVVFREIAGLDSQIQAAGRCNREGKLPYEQSYVYIFKASDEYKSRMPGSLRRPTEISSSIARQFSNVSSPEAIYNYFSQLYKMEGNGLDIKRIVQRFEEGIDYGLSFPFAEVASEFRLIEDTSHSILIPFDVDVEHLLQRLRSGERSRALLRKIQSYIVNVYDNDFYTLYDAGLIERLDDEVAILIDIDRYSKETGLDTSVYKGIGIFVDQNKNTWS